MARGLLLLFVICTGSISDALAQRIAFGVFSGNVQYALNADDRLESDFTHPYRPSYSGVEILLKLGKQDSSKRFNSAFLLQVGAGGYWYSDTRYYSRYQGQVVQYSERRTRLWGLGIAYQLDSRLFSWSSFNLGDQKLSLLSRARFHFIQGTTPGVDPPYHGMYSLEIRSERFNLPELSVYAGLSFANKYGQIHLGPQWQLLILKQRRLGYGLGYIYHF